MANHSLLTTTSLPVISFKNVSKEFTLQNHKTFKEMLPAFFSGQKIHNNFTALSNINFSVNKGEALGIIGPNGSGKSTILKLIAGVMTPTSGTVNVRGKISPLIELGAGFHPELTGRENIYLNGSILGLKQKQIDAKFKDIVDFSELWDFIDQPVKHYSSGMYMRLAFSVAIHADPEILIVDEILAVGDTQFQQKCFARMNQFKKNKITIIFVSHSLSTVESFCTRVIYLNHSKIVVDGKPAAVCKKYKNLS
jgi:ABC-type polysaccharide/polyol phosphate transport system ATPase subunit